MKNTQNARRSIIVIALIVGTWLASGLFLGCQRTNPIEPDTQTPNLMAEPDWNALATPPAYEDPSMPPPAYSDAYYDQDYDEQQGDHETDHERGWHKGFHMRPLFDFGRIAHELNLTKDQRDSAKLYLREYRECVRFALDSLHRSEKVILRAFHAKLDTIHGQVRDSVITRDSAKTLIHQAREQLSQDLKNNPVRAWAKDHIEECKKEFFKKFEAILTPEQMEKWKKIKEHLK